MWIEKSIKSWTRVIKFIVNQSIPLPFKRIFFEILKKWLVEWKNPKNGSPIHLTTQNDEIEPNQRIQKLPNSQNVFQFRPKNG